MFSILLTTMLLTAIIETIFLWWCGYHRVLVLAYFFGLNMISNCSANILYKQMTYMAPKPMLMILLELGVILFEYALLGLLTGYSKKLISCVALANAFSFIIGLILFTIS